MPAVHASALAGCGTTMPARHTDLASTTGFRNTFKDLVSWRTQCGIEEDKRTGSCTEAAAYKALAKAETFVDVSAVGLTRIQRTWSVAPEYNVKGGVLQGAAGQAIPSAPTA